MIEKAIEIEGVQYLAWKREVPDDLGEEGIEIRNEYSLDRGETWAATLAEAFVFARDSGSLVKITERGGDNDEGFEAFVVTLLKEFQTLKVGETIKIGRTQEELVVLREQVVLVTKASTVRDVDLRMEEKRG